jgi:hypothetical protein
LESEHFAERPLTQISSVNFQQLAAQKIFCLTTANSWHVNVQRLKQDSLDSLSWLWFEKAGDHVSKQARKENVRH